jgi:hypothetical protein
MTFLSDNCLLVTSSYYGKILSFDGESFLLKNILEIKNVYISMIKVIENSNNLDLIALIKPGRLLIWKYTLAKDEEGVIMDVCSQSVNDGCGTAGI